MRQVAHQVGATLSARPEVLAVVLSGSHATRIANAESDLDMYVYCSPQSMDLGIRVKAVRNDDVETKVRVGVPITATHGAKQDDRVNASVRDTMTHDRAKQRPVLGVPGRAHRTRD
jgi:hypothetical protein